LTFFPFISTRIMLGLLYPCSACRSRRQCGGNLNSDLIASCVRSIFAKNY